MDRTGMRGLELCATACPICHTLDNAKELYPKKLSEEAFNAVTFSARRLPDRVHYRVVRCGSCGLVRSDPVADASLQAELYRKSSFDYGDQVDNLRDTYGRYLQRAALLVGGRGALLEIGCGNGFLLAEALRLGFASVTGVEPSTAAVEAAEPAIRPRIICDIMRPGLLPPAEFDVVAMFQTFDHIPDPNALLDECFTVLKPGGALLCLNHNAEAVSARLMRERSPIIDVEHPFLYSPTTMIRIARAHGFEVLEAGHATNRVTLRYLAWLAPLPRRVKTALVNGLKRIGLGRMTFSLPLGNLYLVARKPSAEVA